MTRINFCIQKISCARPCAGLFKVYKGGARQAWEVLMENFLRGFEVRVLLPSLPSHSQSCLGRKCHGHGAHEWTFMSPHLYTIVGSVFRWFPAVDKKKTHSKTLSLRFVQWTEEQAWLFLIHFSSGENSCVQKNIPNKVSENQAIIRSRGFAVSTRCLFDVCGWVVEMLLL